MLLLAFAFISWQKNSMAQTDSLQFPRQESTLGEPTRAALMSAAFPGMGQLYNKKYWKLPIVYGGFAYFISTIIFYDQQYNRFRRNLLYASDNNPDTSIDPEFERLRDPVQTLLRERDRAVRERDFHVILLLLFYGVQIADAAVDAHLKGFDVSDNLSLQVRPQFKFVSSEHLHLNQWYAGTSFTFSIQPKTSQKIMLSKISE